MAISILVYLKGIGVDDGECCWDMLGDIGVVQVG